MNSIRESFDNLPVAVCFFDKRGVVRLMNRRMLSVGAELLGSGVQTLEERFWDFLYHLFNIYII